MYAAAGGASLASRQARQRQRQQKKTQQLQAKLHPPKASVLSVAEHGASTPTRHSRQFHQLPTNYLRTPQAQARKLSASYTAQSKLLLPIDEGDTQSVLQMRVQHTHTHTLAHAHLHHSHSHATAQFHHYHYQPYQQQPPQQQHFGGGYHHGRVSPKLVHRHSGSSGTSFHHSHLPKSATATLPLVSQMEATPPTTPASAVAAAAAAAKAGTSAADHDAIAPPHHDAIIVTPATPLASPGHAAKQQQPQQQEELPEAAAEKQPLTAGVYDDDEPMEPPTGPLERKCSVYRMRRNDAYDLQQERAEESVGSVGGVGSGVRRQLKDLQFSQQQQQQYEPLLSDEPQLVFQGLPNGRKWQTCAYCEEGICVCEHIECAQGRAAWLERGRRCSVQESQQQAAACHRRWVKRNRIQDASLGGSSDDEDFLGVLRGPSTFANAFLYVGLGTIALGLVIAFVGTGEKGFKTVELRLIGPSLIGIGLICCILRILFCICPSHCISSSKKSRKKTGNKVDADHTTSLLRGESKRVSIARGPSMQPKYPITHKRSNSKMLNEGMEALRQIATTSLFMQNEQKPSMNRVVPIIKEPENPIEAPPLEMQKLETALKVCEIGADYEPAAANAERSSRQVNNNINTSPPAFEAQAPTAATTATTSSAANNNATIATTTTATTINERSSAAFNAANKLSRQRVALNQQSQQPPPQQHQQSHSLSSSSTVKDSIDEDLLMETSLTITKPPSLASEARPSVVNGNGIGSSSTVPSQSSHTPTPATSASTSTGTGAIPRLTSAVTVATTAATSSTALVALPPPPTYTGAISRVASAPHTAAYDLPSAKPHTYASTLSASRSATERESLIRGPLGMPLSALTASCSTYAFSATPTSTPTPVTTANSTTTANTTTTSTTTASTTTASTTTASTTTANTTTASTTINQLPPPAPATLLSTTANYNHASIPGQVQDTTSVAVAAAATSYSATVCLRPLGSAPPASMGNGSVETTSRTTFLPSTMTSEPAPAPRLTQPAPLTPSIPAFASALSFKFPAPLSSSSSASSSASASSHGRAGALPTASAAATAAPTTTLLTAAGGSGTILAPPATPPVSKFEPELLLSPAKLGQ